MLNFTGNILHILWDCLVLRAYWWEIFQILSMVTHTQVCPSPDLALLNLVIETFVPPVRHSVTHILLAARFSINRLWENPQTPTVLETLDLIHKHCTYQLMLASSKGSHRKSLSLWQPWLLWHHSTKQPSLT